MAYNIERATAKEGSNLETQKHPIIRHVIGGIRSLSLDQEQLDSLERFTFIEKQFILLYTDILL